MTLGGRSLDCLTGDKMFHVEESRHGWRLFRIALAEQTVTEWPFQMSASLWVWTQSRRTCVVNDAADGTALLLRWSYTWATSHSWVCPSQLLKKMIRMETSRREEREGGWRGFPAPPPADCDTYLMQIPLCLPCLIRGDVQTRAAATPRLHW